MYQNGHRYLLAIFVAESFCHLSKVLDVKDLLLFAPIEKWLMFYCLKFILDGEWIYLMYHSDKRADVFC